jgi:hypothetical protein
MLNKHRSERQSQSNDRLVSTTGFKASVSFCSISPTLSLPALPSPILARPAPSTIVDYIRETVVIAEEKRIDIYDNESLKNLEKNKSDPKSYTNCQLKRAKSQIMVY